MTERPSQTRQILEKLDVLSEEISEVKRDITEIKTKMELQPVIDEAKEKALLLHITDHDKRIKGLEDNQRWLVLAVLGAVLAAIMQVVLK